MWLHQPIAPGTNGSSQAPSNRLRLTGEAARVPGDERRQLSRWPFESRRCCSHIANATIRRAIDKQCRASGYEPPVICTPQELIER